MIGKTISHYKILEKLGEGGMGVVYKAEDTKLDRTVALKFLTSQALGDEGDKARFVHEAKAAAVLGHPNICTVYEIDEADGQIFIAMECVEGQSLKDKVESSPLKLDEAIDLASQIAEGLHEAHEQGIVHRDVKPANIMVTSKGQAKIMDFGLAKSVNRTTLTKTGTTLGTVAYMSPEQARGDAVDHRTDIWSLGAVLYEMVTGQKPFKGDYEPAVVYSILNQEPEPMTGLRTGVPMELERVVAKAMVKDPDDRYQHVNELPVDLKAVKAGLGGTASTRPTLASKTTGSGPAWWKQAIPWMLVLLMVITAILAMQGVFGGGEHAPRPVGRFTHSLPSTEYLWIAPVVQQPSVALSPDGSKVVYVSSSGGVQSLHLREIDEFEARPIPGTEDARSPFFSPDGEWVAFLTGGELKKVSLNTGASVVLCDVFPDITPGGSWSEDGNILFTPMPEGGFVRIPASGGSPELVTLPDTSRGEVGHWYPKVLPGGKGMLFAIWTGGGFSNTDIGVLSVVDGEWHTIIEGGTSPHYLSSGHIIYARAGGLFAVKFDIERLEVVGSPVKVIDSLVTLSGAEFSLSENGSIVYIPGTGGRPKFTLVWVNRDGQMQELPLPPTSYSYPRISPDGTRLLTTITDQETGNYDIWVSDLERNTKSRLTFDPEVDATAIWTRDGSRATFAAISPDKGGGVVQKLADGTGEEEAIVQTITGTFPTSWSPDGRTLLFTFEKIADTGFGIWMTSMDGEQEPQPVLETQFSETAAVFSPDGRWIAYQSDESGRYEIYAMPFNGSGAKQQVSIDGGIEPVWSPDGRELFFRSGDKMMAVSVQSAAELVVEGPEVLFEGRYMRHRLGANYDVSPDGQRFLMVKRSEPGAGAPTELKIILNWSEEISRYFPAEK